MTTAAKYAYMVDTTTGTVLLDKNGDAPMAPSSMSKLMTGFMLFEQLRDGRVKMDDTFPISERAYKVGGSTMFAEVNTRVAVEDLIRGMIVVSGNDACVAIAEALASSEDAFAVEMTKRGREIGLTNSTFKNATGLPAADHLMSPRDLATLAQRIIADFPQYYHFYSEKEFRYGKQKQGNRNPLLYKNIGADGLKTGHTNDAGYGLTASVIRNGRRLVLVVNGLTSMNERSRESERLIDWGFREWESYAIAKVGDAVDNAPVWLGEEATVPVGVASNFTATLKRTSRPDMKVTVKYDGPVAAPVVKGMPVGTLTVTAPNTTPLSVPLVATADVPRLGVFGRMAASLRHLVGGKTS
jgi:D-alanyl-D-alanine carboxypeptidase (penicillin-binding protein 5/6)